MFESQFQFFTQRDCLRHYEKGIAKGIFGFDRSRVGQVWASLALWGLIGRVNPVEVVRALCAFGCELQRNHQGEVIVLQKSFYPVTYYLPVSQGETPGLRHHFHKSLVKGDEDHIPLLLELKDRLVLGHYYSTEELDADQQLPAFCSKLENDLCFVTGIYQSMLSTLFYEGLEIRAETHGKNILLARNDLSKNTLTGIEGEQTLFFVGQAKRAA